MSDFMREVDEEYRRDRVVAFLAKHQILLIGLVVAIVAGAGGYRIYEHYQTQAAESANSRYDSALQLVREGKGSEAQAVFDKIQSEGPAGYAVLARMKAVEALALRDPAAAARGFDAIAFDAGVDASFRDTAQIRSAIIRVDSDDPKAFEARYTPIAVEGFAYRASLRELLALAAFKRNDTDAAGRWLDQIVTDPQAPSALRSRAEAFLSLVAAGPAETGTPAPARPAIEVPVDGTSPGVSASTPSTPAPATATPATPAAPPTTQEPDAPMAPAPAAQAPEPPKAPEAPETPKAPTASEASPSTPATTETPTSPAPVEAPAK